MVQINLWCFLQAVVIDFIGHQSSGPDLARKYDKELSEHNQYCVKKLNVYIQLMLSGCLLTYGSKSAISGAKTLFHIK